MQTHPLPAVFLAAPSAASAATGAAREPWHGALEFRALAETLPALVFASAADGQGVYVNQRYCRYTGLPPYALMRAGWRAALHPDDAAAADAASRSTLIDRDSFEVELRLRRHDGVYRWHLVRAAPMLDPDGNALRWMGVAIDVDETHRAKERAARDLVAARAAFRNLADTLPVPVWSADDDGRLDFVNEAWVAMAGLPRGVGADWRDLALAADLGALVERWDYAVETGEPFDHGCRLNDRIAGGARPHLAQALRYTDADGGARWYGAFVPAR